MRSRNPLGPQEDPVRGHEGRRRQASEEAQAGNAQPKRIVADQALDIDINLAVMATGTVKIVVADLDYCRLRDVGRVDSLFVGHRDEILGQSMAMVRHIMRDGSFGEGFVGGERPVE